MFGLFLHDPLTDGKVEALGPVEMKPKSIADRKLKPHFDIGSSGKFVLVVTKPIELILLKLTTIDNKHTKHPKDRWLQINLKLQLEAWYVFIPPMLIQSWLSNWFCLLVKIYIY